MAQVQLTHVSKTYDKTPIIQDLNLTVADHEFVVLVGPSGCGKSTVLRMIAGLEEMTAGTIAIDDRVVNDVSPKDRDIAMVFQSYALYPHMSVYDNMAFGLKMRKTPKAEIKLRVESAAQILDLSHLLTRKPKQLSGGQRQRVALGRAIVRNPKVFLMDEPLSNLDATLRVQMRTEILKLHRRLNATTLYVTHDQTEAMTMGDRIVVLNQGMIQQVGDPATIYNLPINMFVGGFMGSMTFLNATYANGIIQFANQERWPVPEYFADALTRAACTAITLGIRPEHFSFNAAPGHLIPVVPDLIELLGHEKRLHFMLADQPAIAALPPEIIATEGTPLTLTLHLDKIAYFDAETQQNVLAYR